ncbi:hypothetical protein ABIB75_007497 [Bradyrhizobium sp. GM2.2]|uniref:hypothetical protein n=1 Tax=Bradyrhizobium sp. GM2.2 TaxID=3156358 RepID=UPI00339103A8
MFAPFLVALEDSRRLREQASALRAALREQRELLRLARAEAAMDRAEMMAVRENLRS